MSISLLQSFASTWSGMAAAAGVVLVLAGGGWWWGGRRRGRRPAGKAQAPMSPSDPAFARVPAAYEAAALAPESAVHLDMTIDRVAERTGAWQTVAPEGFDSIGFLQAAKRNFVRLQAAWDAADIATLASLMTEELLAHIRHQLAERGDRPNRTDVVMLEARLIGVEDLGPAWLASIEFSGMIREEVSAGAAPFREVWSLTKPRDGSTGWLLAGVQALQ